ncbi:zinc-binding dehydrogenase [Euzebya sp.]|uniref:zinc-binding dehydrogenase n=1 Tax=Euzebya sp. TaxID=1971409 RepID=UPI003511E27B
MLGVYGIPGITAYIGVTRYGRPEPGDTVLVTAAAGATGSVAAQIARTLGCRVIGVAGGSEKCRWATDVAGLDACLDHHEADLPGRLRAAAPEGVAVVLDGVGGPVLDAALVNLARGARVVVVGALSTGYDGGTPTVGIHHHVELGLRRARMEGFVVLDHLDAFGEAVERLHGWVEAGDIVVAEHVVDGLEHAPAALAGLFTGRNLGKQLVRVGAAPAPTR